jgi:hypothetical protein
MPFPKVRIFSSPYSASSLAASAHVTDISADDEMPEGRYPSVTHLKLTAAYRDIRLLKRQNAQQEVIICALAVMLVICAAVCVCSMIG